MRGDPSCSGCAWCCSNADADGVKAAAMVRAVATPRAGLIHPGGMGRRSMAEFKDACQ